MSASPSESELAAEAESLSLRCLVLLEQLQPVERAAFLLHRVFGLARADTARAVGVSDEACRYLLRRGGRVVAAAKPRIEAEREARRAVETRFRAALGDRDAQRLAELLAPDAVASLDAPDSPTVGRRAVARALAELRGDLGDVTLEIDGHLVQSVSCRAVRDRETRG